MQCFDRAPRVLLRPESGGNTPQHVLLLWALCAAIQQDSDVALPA